MVVARRPTIDSRELADLDEAVAARGGWSSSSRSTSTVSRRWSRRSPAGQPRADARAAVHAASAGLPAVAVAVAARRAGHPSPALVARVQRRLALLDPAAAGLARVLALRLDLADDRCCADGVRGHRRREPRSPRRMRTLRDEGLLVPGTETMIPAVAEALLAELPAAERRRVHEAVARALVGAGADPLAAATQLRAARALTPGRGGGLPRRPATGCASTTRRPRSAGTTTRSSRAPTPAAVAAGRAEAAALLGLPVDRRPARGARATRTGWRSSTARSRPTRAGPTGPPRRCSAAADPGPLLAVPSLVATGRLDDGPRGRRERSRRAGRRCAALAEAALAAAADPAAAVPLLIEAAEAAGARRRRPWCCRTPPHALGALVAVDGRRRGLGRAPAGAGARRPASAAGRRRRGTGCCWPGYGCGPAGTTPRWPSSAGSADAS